jgi:2-iminoacetate synthase
MSSELLEQFADAGLDDSRTWKRALEAVSDSDVERELAKPAGIFSLERLRTLASPVARAYLEQMARIAQDLTIRRFGRIIQLYAPLYLSNVCVNACKYCGYNASGGFKRTQLCIAEAMAEADIIAAEGFRHILLVSCEDRKFITVDYLSELCRGLREKFSSISIEIFQLETADYRRLFDAGVDGIALYQETYDRELYKELHRGPKADYDRRLRAHDDAAQGGMRRLGLGALLGLNDWQFEAMALGVHANYLMKRYWRSQVSFSFPRLRPAHDVGCTYDHLLNDAALVQMILALRLCFRDCIFYLSTRERAELRDKLVCLGITSMSAGSKTNPGGYSGRSETVGQFEVSDERPPAQIAQMVRAQGYEAVWKDWDTGFTA